MYTENALRDAVLVTKACASNAIARFAPATYVKLTHQTGRGSEHEDATAIADYFVRCFDDYRLRLGMSHEAFGDFVDGKRILEYGPGDLLGVALLFYAHGAARVDCVDRFPLQNVTPLNAAAYTALVDRLPTVQRQRGMQAFTVPGRPESGLRSECIDYRVTSDGLSGQQGCYDLIVSRAVLEHVNSLEATLHDIDRALAPGGLSAHSVDLRSHNLDRDSPFDFLTWPPALYRLMYSHKGFPNRWRVNAYRELLRRTGLRVLEMTPTGRLAEADVVRIESRIPPALRGATRDELSWLGFWMVLEQAGSS